jgi:hypothetical protein
MVLAISFFMMMCFALSLQALPPLFEQIMKDVSNRFDIKKLIIAALNNEGSTHSNDLSKESSPKFKGSLNLWFLAVI